MKPRLLHNSGIPPAKLVLYASLLLCGAAAMTGCAIPRLDEVSLHRQWQLDRAGELTRPDGWLALVGKHRLRDGTHKIGSAPDSDIVLPRGPAEFGVISVAAMEVTVTSAPGTVLLGEQDQPQGTIPLRVGEDGVPATVVGVESLTLFINDDAGPVLLVMDAASPAIEHFAGLRYYRYDPGWVVKAGFRPHVPPRQLDTTNAEGNTSRFDNPGRVEFLRGGSTHSLEVLTQPGTHTYFVIFADATNRNETYGAGRFLEAEPASNGQVRLDFNRAYNPPCVFTPYNNCPLPPPGNRLRLAVTAGEKRFEPVLDY